MVNLLELSPEDMKTVRKEISMVFQDPINSLNPRMTVSDIVAEPLTIHGLNLGPETEAIVIRLLERVGLLHRQQPAEPDHQRPGLAQLEP